MLIQDLQKALSEIAKLTDPLQFGCAPPKAVESIHAIATAAIEKIKESQTDD